MAEEVVTTEETRPRDTVVVREGNSTNVGAVILGIIVILFLLFWFVGNPFKGSTNNNDSVDVNVPTPTVNTPSTQNNQTP